MFDWSFIKIKENLLFRNLRKNPYRAKAIYIHSFSQF